jgi:hypothetical protein
LLPVEASVNNRRQSPENSASQAIGNIGKFSDSRVDCARRWWGLELTASTM